MRLFEVRAELFTWRSTPGAGFGARHFITATGDAQISGEGLGGSGQLSALCVGSLKER